MDAYGTVLDCGPSAFHHEQRLRGDDLVLLTRVLGHL